MTIERAQLRFELRDIVHRYGRRASRQSAALVVPRLSVAAGESLALLGPNGSGKSTLLEVLGALIRPTQGVVLHQGREVWPKSGWPFAIAGRTTLEMRRQTPLLTQRTTLLSRSVLRNVMYGLEVRGVARREAKPRAEAALDRVQLLALAGRRSHQLSGGEQRRVALASLLAIGAKTLLLDEPTAGLDDIGRASFERLLIGLNRDDGLTLVFSTHDRRQAHRVATRTLGLFAGRTLDGPADNVLRGYVADEGGLLRFRSHEGLELPLCPSIVADCVDVFGDGPSDSRCGVAIRADRIRVTSGIERQQSDECVRLAGTLLATRREAVCVRCEVETEWATLLADMPLGPGGESSTDGLRLGRQVTLELLPGAVQVLPERRGESAQ